MREGYQTSSPVNQIGGANITRERDHNCIEMHLKNIEAELDESLNSAVNLADKLKGTQPTKGEGGIAPQPGDVTSRLALILEAVRAMNQQLGRAHSAISG
jgi:hypothetical protein